jgi:transcriptional regulator with GAF, ATPase, and Fis domain
VKKGRENEDQKETDRLAATLASDSLTLRTVRWEVVDGPQKGRSFQIEDDPIQFGTANDNSVVLQDSSVSRHHAVVTATEQGLLIRDLASTNGTFVDGHRVREIFLKPGVTVRIGQTSMIFSALSVEHSVMPHQLDRYEGLLGKSVAMRHLFACLDKVAARQITVILHGETGSGKEVCARAIHSASNRAAGPFIVLDCSALDPELGGSELFGHEVGAFTGATQTRQGAFELAANGTVFVDELGELSLSLQAKLLRVLEMREVKRLGGSKPIGVNCRIVAATHRDLQEMVKAGTFRQDLYFRFAQVVLPVPPLRARRDDIPLLVERFLAENQAESGKRFGLTPEALKQVCSAELPGNVRELRNLILRGCTMATGDRITPEDLGLAAPAALESEESRATEETRAAPAPLTRVEEAEKETIIAALVRNDYQRVRTAKELGMSVPTLRSRMRQYGLRPALHLGSPGKN